jgi:hypothetical protein
LIEVRGHLYASAVLRREEPPLPIEEEAGWAPELACEKIYLVRLSRIDSFFKVACVNVRDIKNCEDRECNVR